MSDLEDERIERDKLNKNLTGWLVEAYRARGDLLNEQMQQVDKKSRELKCEIEQLKRKQIRLESNLKRMSVADLRVLHFVFQGHESEYE